MQIVYRVDSLVNPWRRSFRSEENDVTFKVQRYEINQICSRDFSKHRFPYAYVRFKFYLNDSDSIIKARRENENFDASSNILVIVYYQVTFVQDVPTFCRVHPCTSLHAYLLSTIPRINVHET